MGEWTDPRSMLAASVSLAMDLLSGKRLLRYDKWSFPSKVWVSEMITTEPHCLHGGPAKNWDRLILSPIQVLALAVLRDDTDEGACAAFLDEVMESRKFLDEPVTEEWCKRHGWIKVSDDSLIYINANRDPHVSLMIGKNSSQVGVYHDNDYFEVSRDPTVLRVVQLCRALGIPWSASDPLGK